MTNEEIIALIKETKERYSKAALEMSEGMQKNPPDSIMVREWMTAAASTFAAKANALDDLLLEIANRGN
jgi:hypothetical protein